MLVPPENCSEKMRRIAQNLQEHALKIGKIGVKVPCMF